MKGKGVAPAGAPLWRYLVVDMDGLLDMGVGVPITSAMRGDGHGILPAGRYALVLHTGHPSELGAVTAALLAWAEASGIERFYHDADVVHPTERDSISSHS